MAASDRVKKGTAVTVVSRVAERARGTRAPKEACLVVVYGAELGKKYPLGRPAAVLGRSSKSDVQVDQESVSRAHARLISTGQSVILRDLGSTNGTYVNDELIDEYVLRDGDLVRIGRTIFKFLAGNDVETAYHEEIYRLTTIDGLTQLYNRRFFLETLEREIGRAHRYHRELSLVVFDPDHLAQVNDAHGQLAGDAVLRQLAGALRGRIRREDVLARYGGDEFAAILPEIDAYDARRFGEKIRRLVESTTFRFENARLPVTISVGVATLAPPLTGPADLVRVAEERLERAKAEGRNRVCA